MTNSKSMIEIYDTYFKQANNSKAHSAFCTNVFGIDLTQDGFSDKKQMDFMIEKVSISSKDHCLDIGCGNGKISNYIFQKTKASIDGIDSSRNAIDFANSFSENNNHLNFTLSDINTMNIKDNHYSVIYLIDTLYFSNNYEKTISDLYVSLKNNGRIALFYSEFEFNRSKQIAHTVPDHTAPAKIFKKMNLKYTAFDFTSDHYELMKRKHTFSQDLKAEYIKEGNEKLFEKINDESISPDMTYEEFIKFSNRYLFILQKSDFMFKKE